MSCASSKKIWKEFTEDSLLNKNKLKNDMALLGLFFLYREVAIEVIPYTVSLAAIFVTVSFFFLNYIFQYGII